MDILRKCLGTSFSQNLTFVCNTIHLSFTRKVKTFVPLSKSEGLAPAANPSPVTPPRVNPNKEATRTKESPSATASPPSEEAVGEARAADGG